MNKLYSESVNTFLSLLVTWFVLATGAFFISSGQLDGILLAMFVLISLTVFEDAGPMAALPIHLQDSQRAASRLSAVATETPHTAGGHGSIQLTQARSITTQVSDVSFTFPGEKRQALKQINITFPAGSKTAIAGPSGSGKSTLLQLLLGLSQADSGTITLDGIPVEQIAPESIWEHSAVMLQENHFFLWYG